ncbi:MAG: alpha-ketoglutarate-dependent dioxygenase AlkB [Chloroflexi bacterium]|nr:alpha-ketoglutarate-dependent dioxygenase AlkB [Chloroflexota bacterium]
MNTHGLTDTHLTAIPGLTSIPDYITSDDETCLLAQLDQQPWSSDLRRRVQHYGYRYDYKARMITPEMQAAPLPPWLQELARRVQQDGHTPTLPDQVIVNEYVPGQGIADHIDCVPCFGNSILSLSLGSGCAMRFTEQQTRAQVPLWLAPRSLLLLQGAARYEWLHGIPARKSDLYNGQRVQRGRRVNNDEQQMEHRVIY